MGMGMGVNPYPPVYMGDPVGLFLCRGYGYGVVIPGGYLPIAISRHEWGDLPSRMRSISQVVAIPRSTCIHHALPPSRPPDGVHWCSLEGSASGSSPPAILLPKSSRSWWRRRSCLPLVFVRGVQPHGDWHSSAIARLQRFSSRSLVATSGWWSSTRMTTSLVVERSEPGCGLPCPQLQGCSSSALGRRASRVGAPPSAWAGGPLLPPAFGGEARSPALRRRRTSATRGRPSEAPSAASCLAPRPGWLWCRLRCCLLPLGRGVHVRPPHGQRLRLAQVGHIHGFSRAAGRPGGSYKTSYAAGAAAVFLDGPVLTPVVRTGARTSSRMLGQPPPIGAEVVAAVGGADVVATAGEAAHCRGGCLRW
jgi:hypothetical protein